MNLILPVPTVSLGPQWASQLNAALTLIDEHDHSSGKGRRITPLGLNINSDLSIGSQNRLQLRSARFDNHGSTLAEAQDIRSLSVVNGDLYYNNGAGVPVQITTGTSVNASPTAGPATQFERVNQSSATLTINPTSTYSFIDCNTASNAITINLPAANAVAAGRFYVVGTKGANLVTVVPDGSDTIAGVAANQIINPSGNSHFFISDGSSNWVSTKQALADGEVTLSKLAAPNAVRANINTTTTTVGFALVLNQLITITGSRPLSITIVSQNVGEGVGSGGGSGTTSTNFRLQVLTPGDAVITTIDRRFEDPSTSDIRFPIDLSTLVIPSELSGAGTYKVQVSIGRAGVGNRTASIQTCRLTVMEV